MKTPTPSARTLAGLSLTVAIAATHASAIPLYNSDGFQTRFTTNASLEGQDFAQGPWQITSNANPAEANIRSTVGVGGSPGVEVLMTAGETSTQWYVSKPVTPAGLLNTVVTSWDMNYNLTSTVGLQYGPFFGVEIYDASGGTPKQIGGFGVDSTTRDLLVLIDDGINITYAPLLTPQLVTPGSFNSYSLSVDYTAKTYTVSLNGVPLETDPFIDASATAFTDAPIASRFISNAGEIGLNSGAAYFDNYVINVVPEPTMIGGIAALVLGTVRRRR